MAIERRGFLFRRRSGPVVETRRGSAPSFSSRAVPVLLTFVGSAIIMITQAVQRGIIVGVEVSSMAHVFGGVLIVLGIMGFGRKAEEPAAAPPETGPLVESGRDPHEADEEALLRETLRRLQEDRARQQDARRR